MEIQQELYPKLFINNLAAPSYVLELNISNVYNWLEWAEENLDKVDLQKEKILNLKKMLKSKDSADQTLALELYKKLTL